MVPNDLILEKIHNDMVAIKILGATVNVLRLFPQTDNGIPCIFPAVMLNLQLMHSWG